MPPISRWASPNDVVPALFQAGTGCHTVRRFCIFGDRNRCAGAGRRDEHRRRQSVTRNVWKSYVNPGISHAGEAAVAKIASLVVKVGALAFILFLPT